MSWAEEEIVRRVADTASRRITRIVIARLQHLKSALLSGEDSGLTNAWDEICAQVQSEHAAAWEAYDVTMRQYLETAIDDLAPHEKSAIWLQTDSGAQWNDESGVKSLHYSDDDIVDYLVAEWLLKEAGNWTNSRIRKYLDPPGSDD